MAIYVLGTQCLLDIAKKDGNRAQIWFDGMAARNQHFGDVTISAYSVALVQFLFEDHPPVTLADRQLKINVDLLIDQFKITHAVLDCSKEAIYYWAHNLGRGIQYDQPPPAIEIGAEALVLATVATPPPGVQYTLVDRRQTVHQQLALSVHDPY